LTKTFIQNKIKCQQNN